MCGGGIGVGCVDDWNNATEKCANETTKTNTPNTEPNPNLNPKQNHPKPDPKPDPHAPAIFFFMSLYMVLMVFASLGESQILKLRRSTLFHLQYHVRVTG